MRPVIVFSLLSFSGAFTLPAEHRVAEWFATVPACDVLEFSSDGIFSQLGRGDQKITVRWLNIVWETTEHALPRVHPHPYRSGESRRINSRVEREFVVWPKHDQFRSLLKDLALQLGDGRGHIDLKTIVRLADERLQAAKSAAEVGECYKVAQVTHTFNTAFVTTEALSPPTQRYIDSLFQRPLDIAGLDPKESALFRAGRLTLAEIAELRAIRETTGIFKQNTSLRHDVGGYKGNMNFFAPIRTVCQTEAQTYYFFLRRLQQRGLLHHFKPSETWAFRPTVNPFDGHAATLIESRRTGDLFVLDSWHEHGGTPAHITDLRDWLQGRDRADVVAARTPPVTHSRRE